MKYIVYKTTNIVNNYIYIGVHHTNDDLKFDYYIGNGVDIRKPSTYEKAKTKFQQAVKEFGVSNFKRETLAAFDNDIDAYNLEETLVNEEFLSREDVYNMILGGRVNHYLGVEVFLYDLEGKYLNTFKSYTDAAEHLKIDATTVRMAVLYKLKVKEKYYFNTDKLPKLDLSNYNNIQKVKVYRYLKNGLFDCEFDSYGEAGRQSNSSPANVRKGCILGYCVKDLYYFSLVKESSYDKARKIYIEQRKVFQYNSDGDFLKEYNSQKEAELLNQGSNITKAIKNKSVDFNGFMWSLEKLEKFNCKGISKNTKKKVGQFDNNGTLIKTWDSARKACKEMGCGVQNVLYGKYNKHKGYIYKYIE